MKFLLTIILMRIQRYLHIFLLSLKTKEVLILCFEFFFFFFSREIFWTNCFVFPHKLITIIKKMFYLQCFFFWLLNQKLYEIILQSVEDTQHWVTSHVPSCMHKMHSRETQIRGFICFRNAMCLLLCMFDVSETF